MAEAESKNETKQGTATAAPRTSMVQFFTEVRNETSKVTWPTRRETTVSTVLVFVMAVIAMLFFFLVDSALAWAVQMLLSIGR